MTAPAPSAPISTSRLAHARALGARPPPVHAGARAAAARGGGAACDAEGAGQRGARGSSRGHARPPALALGSAAPAAAPPPVQWQRRTASLHNKPAAAPGLEGGREDGKEGGEEGHALPPESPPRRGRAEGRGRRARSGPSTGSPPGGRARPHSGGWGRGTPKPKRAGGPEQQLLSPGSLPRSGRPAAGWPESRRQPGEGLTYTVNELVAPRVQFLPKAASLNGALLPPTHPRHLLPPARPCLRRGPAHAQPRRPGPRTHPRPGRRASRRGRRGGRADLTSRWPRRGPGGGLGARPPAPSGARSPGLRSPRPLPLLAFQKAPSSGRSWAPPAPC